MAAQLASTAAAGALLLGAGPLGSFIQPAGAVSFKELQGLTYMQIKGTGLANQCPTIEAAGTDSTGANIKSGSYEFKRMCMEPDAFTVKTESGAVKGADEEGFIKSDVVTRMTYSLDAMEGTMKVGSDGSIDVLEREGMDFQPVTLQIAGGERVPLLFTIKSLDAKGSGAPGEFSGSFDVPSYRGGSFLDPKFRGATLGYDSANALVANADSEELKKENAKTTATLKGSAKFAVKKYDAATGEIAGVFETVQPSDTDLGSKAPKDIKVTGQWYAQI